MYVVAWHIFLFHLFIALPAVRFADADNCTDGNPVCDQKCELTENGLDYKCSCFKGYYLQSDQKSCKVSDEEEPSVLFSTVHGVYIKEAKDTKPKEIYSNGVNPRYLAWYDDDFMDEKVYLWTYKNQVTRYYSIFSDPEDHIRHGLHEVTGIAFDWIGENMYLADSGLHCVVACSELKQTCGRVLCEGNLTFLAFAVDPVSRQMFWSTAGNAPKLEKASLDGLHRETILQNNRITSIVTDWTSERIFYASSDSSSIESFRMDGKNRLLVAADLGGDILSMAVFEDLLYYTQVGSNSIMIMNKFDGKNKKQWPSVDYQIYAVQLVHSALHIKEEAPCKITDCPELCLLSSVKGYSCACFSSKDGEENSSECSDERRPPYMIVADQREIVEVSMEAIGLKLKKSNYPLLADNLVALDYDYSSGMLFFSDVGKDHIASIPLDGLQRSSLKKIIVEDVGTADDIAVDWISKNIYWTDAQKKVIEVSKFDGTKRLVLISVSPANPRAIVVHPLKGVLFYSTVGQASGEVTKCDMDGRNCELLIELQEPNGLVIDYHTDLLYLVDSKQKSISVVGLDGNKMRTIVVDQEAPNMYGIALYKDSIYWTVFSNFNTDVHYSPVKSDHVTKMKVDNLSNKFTGLVLVSQENQIEGTNACWKSNCSGLCLPKPDHGKSCFCPPGSGSSCQVECGGQEVLCDGRCKSSVIVCNGIEECIDKSDETDCPVETCGADMFTCSDGSCIKRQLKCDNFPHCEDGSDENSCECTFEEFHCDDTRCIPKSLLCDRFNDCTDKMDEKNCHCKENEFQCRSGHCISKEFVCNGYSNCQDNDDEQNCVPLTCSPDEFICSNNNCVSKSVQCDGQKDCSDGSDESLTLCSGIEQPLPRATPAPPCRKDQFFCEKSGDCIFISWVCDQKVDCEDGEDEMNCPDQTCSVGFFHCTKINQCTPQSWTCDGEEDCKDGTDESLQLCGPPRPRIPWIPTSVPDICDENSHYLCTSGECISFEKVCNNYEDCADSSDEGSQCANACSEEHDRPGGCEHTCKKTPQGSLCLCPEGSTLRHDKRSCSDLNECLAYENPCSQFCENRANGYRCLCADGYHLGDDEKSCMATGPQAYLVFAVGSGINLLTTDQKHFRTWATSMRSQVRAVDYLFINNSSKIYWLDYGMGKVKYYLPEKQKRKTLIKNLGKSEGIAIDWTGKNMYITSEEYQCIFLCQISTKHCIKIISDDIDKPKDIVTTPDGYIFWAEAGIFPRIERASMNGKGRQAIVVQDIAEPLGLAIDYVEKLLYWADPKKGAIESVDYYGMRRRWILRSTTYEPAALDVFENYIYWTDLHRYTIMRSDKRSGGNMIVMHDLTTRPYSIKVVHPLKQPKRKSLPGETENPCDSKCSHLCVLSPSGVECLCPMGFEVDPEDPDRCYIQGQPILPGTSASPTSTLVPIPSATSVSCPANFCKNNGTCLVVKNIPTCICSDGNTGTRCENRTTGSYLDYNFLAHNNYAWIGGLIALAALIVIIVVIVTLYIRRKRRLREHEGLSRPLQFMKGKTTKPDSERRLMAQHSHDSTYDNPGFLDDYNANRKNYTPSATDDSEMDGEMDLPEILEHAMYVETVNSPVHGGPPARYPLSSYRYNDHTNA